MSSRVHGASPGRRRIDILIVDQHQPFRQLLRRELSYSYTDIHVVGDADSSYEAVARLEAVQPSVVLLSTQLRDCSGRDVLRRLFPQPGIAFVGLGLSDSADEILGLIRGGAMGYIFKTSPVREVVTAVRRANAGEAVIVPKVAGYVLNHFRENPRPPTVMPYPDQLTNDERAVLRLIGRGYDLNEIGTKIPGVGPGAVNVLLLNVVQKLRVTGGGLNSA